ncbi:hypothetical protein DPSP01_000109 [Paraphaeosphaeria sporulosa]|uniref:AA1-like domain-containing protein n=1 Tax=Paraphaeosphaeria sporulosa TaxID=1460663 RepID=A0A177D0B6_9PLEO|nr:uncharacterized protein CC84DRAFT_1255111 [Paraphaeosphaeria sporulosa]OAG12966.1 hypothetical protein CC84DRAFT_1255111 [Paraphaeosphaeria sporulosa]
MRTPVASTKHSIISIILLFAVYCIPKMLALALVPLIVLPLALAHPTATTAFEVTNLYTFEPSGRDNVSVYRVAFNVTDPSDGSATACETTWPYAVWDTGYPHDFLANCTDKAWSFKFSDYQNVWDFVLDVKHVSRKTNGKKIKRFAKGTVDPENVLLCTHAGSGFSICTQREGVAFPLVVYKEVKV